MSKANQVFTLKQLEAIELLASGELLRKDIAERLDVARNTLYEWMKIDAFRNAVIDVSRKLLKSKLPEIYNALDKKAKAGDWHHIKILLEHLDNIEERMSNRGANSITFTWDNEQTIDVGETEETLPPAADKDVIESSSLIPNVPPSGVEILEEEIFTDMYIDEVPCDTGIEEC